MGLLYGLDISKYQGDFDFNKAPLKDFVIIRCGYTGQTSNKCYKDEKFDRNLREIKKTNIPYGFYYYSCAKNESDAKREADFIHSLLKNEKFELPVFIDYEYSKVINSLGTKKCNEVIESLGKKLESYGYFVGLYSYEYFLKNATDRFWLWIASYGTNDGTVQKNFNNGKYKMYQFTSQYNGKYDANVLYDASVMKTIRDKGLNGFSKQETPKPSSRLDSLTDEQVADEIIAGKGGWGDGNIRKEKLGARYNSIQTIVNKKLNVTPKKELKIGSKVTIKKGAKDLNTNKKFLSFVYNTIYTVISVGSNYVVFGKNGVATGKVSKSNVILK